MKKLFIIILLAFSGQMFSQQLVYKPRNPNFGGDTFNYQWLLSSAESQNTFEDPNEDADREEDSELERFTENLNSQLLNLVSRSLFNDQFDDGGLAEGTYTFGSLSIDIFPSSEGLVITILDTETGEQTQVIIPE
jgi:curli production assembly/transport component CsgF